MNAAGELVANLPQTVLAVFVLFCRIGTAVMLMPGLSALQIPMRVRLFLVFALTLALSPILVGAAREAAGDAAPLALLRVIGSEVLTGGMIGLLGRFFFLALQALGSTVAMAIGYGGMPGAPIEESEPVPALVSMLTLSATLLFFATDLHWEVLRGIVASYRVLPIGTPFDTRWGLAEIADRLSATFMLALRIASPFVVYAVTVNFAIGIAAKMTPQLPVYFLALPMVLAGGLLLLNIRVEELLRLFATGFAIWAVNG